MLNFISIFRHTKSNVVNVIQKAASSTCTNIETEMKILNDRKEFAKAIALFDKRKYQQMPTDRAIVQALKACTQLRDAKYGVKIHKELSTHSLSNIYIQTTLIHFYMQCGRVNDAEHIFDSCGHKAMGIYGSMMKGYLVNKMPEKAMEIFSMISNPDKITLSLFFSSCSQVGTKEALDLGLKVWSTTSLVNRRYKYITTGALKILISSGDLSSAENLFRTMKPNVIEYGQMMKCYNSHNMPIKTIDLHEKMKNAGLQEDSITFILLVDACAQIGIKSRCQSIVSQIPAALLPSLKLQNCLIHMWGKAGCVLEAKQIFEQIKHPDHVTYNTMINAYGLNGMAADAVELYYVMPKEFMDEGSHVSVLNACSHSGFVNEARSIYQNIQMKTERIYTAMIDCLGRSFFFNEVQELINKFELDHSPYWPMYMSLLSAARNAREADLARKTTVRMRQLFSGNERALTSASVLLANTVASSGDLEESSAIRNNLSQFGGKKLMGLSWTEVNGQIVQFCANDRSHPQTNKIYQELNRILHELIEHGHKFDASWITRPLLPDETVESVLNSHSERLALALNFIQNPVPSEIQITKNLRICGDCHAAIKLISHIRQCQITIRDANRVHHFSNGKCSCLDHF